MKKYWNEKENIEYERYINTNHMTTNLYRVLKKMVVTIRTRYYSYTDDLYDNEAIINALERAKKYYRPEKGSIFNYLSFQLKGEFYNFLVNKKVNKYHEELTVINEVGENDSAFDFQDIEKIKEYIKNYLSTEKEKTEKQCKKKLEFINYLMSIIDSYINEGWYGDTYLAYYIQKNSDYSNLYINVTLKILGLNTRNKKNNEDLKAYEKVLE